MIVKNFAGIKEAELEFRDITVLIGPQAEGKSVIAKLMYIIRGALSLYKSKEAIKFTIGDLNIDTKDKYDILKDLDNKYDHNLIIQSNMMDIFDRSAFQDGYQVKFSSVTKTSNGVLIEKFETICEKYGCKSDLWINKEIMESEIKPVVSFTLFIVSILENFSKSKLQKGNYQFDRLLPQLLDTVRSFILNQIFIPANRSIYTFVQKSPELWPKASLDPIFLDFGTLYENIKNWWFNDMNANNIGKKFKSKYEDILLRFLGGKIIRYNNREVIEHFDRRKVDMIFASSGQKEILPLVLTLLWVQYHKFPEMILYIEEPEAHLFPETQKKLVNLIAEVYNALKGRLRLVITTHSPYIITALNNLLYAGYIRDKFKDRKDVAAKLEKALRRQENIPSLGSRIISPSKVAVYEVKRSGTRSILDENGLISDSYMDEIADELYREEEELYEIKWEVEHGSERYLGQ